MILSNYLRKLLHIFLCILNDMLRYMKKRIFESKIPCT